MYCYRCGAYKASTICTICGADEKHRSLPQSEEGKRLRVFFDMDGVGPEATIFSPKQFQEILTDALPGDSFSAIRRQYDSILSNFMIPKLFASQFQSRELPDVSLFSTICDYALSSGLRLEVCQHLINILFEMIGWETYTEHHVEPKMIHTEDEWIHSECPKFVTAQKHLDEGNYSLAYQILSSIRPDPLCSISEIQIDKYLSLANRWHEEQSEKQISKFSKSHRSNESMWIIALIIFVFGVFMLVRFYHPDSVCNHSPIDQSTFPGQIFTKLSMLIVSIGKWLNSVFSSLGFDIIALLNAKQCAAVEAVYTSIFLSSLGIIIALFALCISTYNICYNRRNGVTNRIEKENLISLRIKYEELLHKGSQMGDKLMERQDELLECKKKIRNNDSTSILGSISIGLVVAVLCLLLQLNYIDLTDGSIGNVLIILLRLGGLVALPGLVVLVLSSQVLDKLIAKLNDVSDCESRIAEYDDNIMEWDKAYRNNE